MTTTSRPHFEAADENTGDLLSLIAEEKPPIPSVREEWDYYVQALKTTAASRAGLIYPNELRPLVRGHVKANRIGAFTHRALRAGLIERTGDWQVSDDTEGRNAGRPMPVMRWLGTPSSTQ